MGGGVYGRRGPAAPATMASACAQGALGAPGPVLMYSRKAIELWSQWWAPAVVPSGAARTALAYSVTATVLPG